MIFCVTEVGAKNSNFAVIAYFIINIAEGGGRGGEG